MELNTILNICIAYNLTFDEFFLIYMTLLARDEEGHAGRRANKKSDQRGTRKGNHPGQLEIPGSLFYPGISNNVSIFSLRGKTEFPSEEISFSFEGNFIFVREKTRASFHEQIDRVSF